MRRVQGTATGSSPSPATASNRVLAATTDAVILCGGRGSRLGALSVAIPKPLLPVAEQPFVLHLIQRMKREGFARIILAAHYQADHFLTFLFAHPNAVDVLELMVEPTPLGTGGALRYVADHIHSPQFLVVNGDTWLSQSLTPVLRAHHEAARACTAVVVHSNRVAGGARRKGVWRMGPHDTVRALTTEEEVTNGWINGGVYVFDRDVVCSWPQGCYDLEANLPSLLRGRCAGLFYSDAHLLDIGTPECYAKAAQVLASAKVNEPWD